MVQGGGGTINVPALFLEGYFSIKNRVIKKKFNLVFLDDLKVAGTLLLGLKSLMYDALMVLHVLKLICNAFSLERMAKL